MAKVYKLDQEEVLKQGINLDSLENIANYLEKELSLRLSITDYKKQETTAPLTWNDVKSALGSNEAAIEVVRFNGFLPDSGGKFTDQVYYAALIVTSRTKSHPGLVLIENGRELEDVWLKYYKNCIRFHVHDDTTYIHFWKAIKDAPVMHGIKKIYLSPDGVYNQININTLVNSETGKYVLDEQEIVVLSNTKDVVQLKRGKGMGNSLAGAVLIGYPDYDFRNNKANETRNLPSIPVKGVRNIENQEKIEYLPGTREEVLKISELFAENGIAVQTLLEAKASEDNIKSPEFIYNSPPVIHIATHGFFTQKANSILSYADTVFTDVSQIRIIDKSAENPLMHSGLLLAGASHAYENSVLVEEIQAVLKNQKVEDGVLTSYEVMNLNLQNTDLVFLSACETGLGEVKNGEGVYGLQRAFQTAGAKSIIMSLWKVDDEATKDFMIHFYQFYFESFDIRKAFYAAQLETRKKYPHPYYWGAFVIIGK
ncbi:MAG: CHAT domain-containing protein [Cytophagaceae bacterium]